MSLLGEGDGGVFPSPLFERYPMGLSRKGLDITAFSLHQLFDSVTIFLASLIIHNSLVERIVLNLCKVGVRATRTVVKAV